MPLANQLQDTTEILNHDRLREAAGQDQPIDNEAGKRLLHHQGE